MSESISKSWFCVFNNPEDHGYMGTPQEIVQSIIEEWCEDNPTRSCAVAYCISVDGLNHLHCVFEDVKAMRFTSIKKAFPTMHIEPTKGSKEQAEDYINKRGKFAEKGEVIVFIDQKGEIKGAKGQRSDLEVIEELLAQGKTPREIMAMSLAFRRHEKIIKDSFFERKAAETKPMRDIKAYWHVGASGSGKSYTYVELVESLGEEKVYMLTDCESGGFDKYCAEQILIIDEFRGQIKFHILLNSILSPYKTQVHSRYSNIVGLWNEVHITSVLPPEKVYQKMVEENRDLDSYEQLRRRIDFVVYHWKTPDGKYHKFIMPIDDYTDFQTLKTLAESSAIYSLPDDIFTPFDSDKGGAKGV